MKRMILCLVALMGALMASAQQANYENEVIKSIMERRSIRKYLDKPVEHEKLALIAKAGINAPSGMNRQPWVVRVVEDQNLIAAINEVYMTENAEHVARDKNFKNMFRNAPNIICVFTLGRGGDLDAGMLGQNMMLAAQSIGLGTCCLGAPVEFLTTNEKAKFFIEKMNVPQGYRLNYILAVGYPDEKPAARPRNESKVEFIK